MVFLWNRNHPTAEEQREVGNDGQRRKCPQRHFLLDKRTLSLLLYSVAFIYLLPNDVIQKA